MMSKRRLRGALSLTMAGVFALASTAGAQTRKQKPRQVLPTGAEDTPAANTAARQKQEQRLERELEQMTSRSDEGLLVVTQANGTETVDLQGRFMSVAVASPTADGGHAVSCQVGPTAVASARREARPAPAPAPVKKTAVLEEK